MLQSQVSFAQWALDVVGTVKKEETKKRMEGATIKPWEHNTRSKYSEEIQHKFDN